MKLKVDLNGIIWEDNPILKVYFPDFYKNDKSKNKTNSDQVLKVLYYLHHPDSEMKELTEDQLVDDLTKSGFLTLNWDRSKYEDIEEIFKKKCITIKEKIVMRWEKKLIERDEFMEKKPYNEANHDMLDKMMSNTKKLWDYYEQALKDLSQERAEQTSGNLVESASEEGVV